MPDTAPSAKNSAVNEAGKNPCLHEAYLLVGGTETINKYLQCNLVISSMEKKQAKGIERWGWHCFRWGKARLIR